MRHQYLSLQYQHGVKIRMPRWYTDAHKFHAKFNSPSVVVAPPRPKPVCNKFETVSSTTKHATKRIAQRRLKRGTHVHAVVDDRTGTLVTAWRTKARKTKKAPKARNKAEIEAAHRRLHGYLKVVT